jgi:hypothetical protein
MAKRKTRQRTGTARPATKRGPAARSARGPAKAKATGRAIAGRGDSAKGSTRSASKRPTGKAGKAVASKSAKVAKIVKKPASIRKKAVARTRPHHATGAVVASSSVKQPRSERQRETVEETLQTPPSSLDMDRHGSAARSGRAALRKSLKEHAAMTPELTSGDTDGNWENAYFSGEEAPGGDNPTPDQNVVDDIGKALGVEYQDGEELQAAKKVDERDEHRWELDPASSEDYKDRK